MPLDIAIVGAGPAGSWAARCLARAGAKVAIFNPEPREKCAVAIQLPRFKG
ncbi:MAG: FAD-dependent oxidoreductase [Acidobacteria bacterium]|nr:FAD-dependent oxidoreductase [Acidobacteriota bacterium]